MSDETVQPRMEGSARAESMSVDRLLQLAGEGRLRMPDFQRPFRWENSDRRDLLDSIYRGYPVGTLLLWKNPPNGPSAGRPLFPGAPTPAQGDTYLIVDGQQRITTLWDALGATPERGKSTLFFDMATNAFVIRQLSQADVDGEAPAATGDALPAAPLYLVRDAATLSEWVPRALPRETKRQYFELGKRLREYTVALYVVEQADLDVLRRVFDRANTSGKPMQREEVFHALVGSRIAGAAGLELVNAELSDLGFGRLEPATVLKAYEAVEGTKIGRLDPRTLDVETAHATLRRTATAFRAAIEFLMTSAAVPHVEVCPYELPLVVLARFFACHPRPSERSRVLLRRWFWRGSLGQRLGGASGTMQQHVNDIVESDESASVQALLERTGMPWQLPPSIDLAEGILCREREWQHRGVYAARAPASAPRDRRAPDERRALPRGKDELDAPDRRARIERGARWFREQTPPPADAPAARSAGPRVQRRSSALLARHRPGSGEVAARGRRDGVSHSAEQSPPGLGR